MPSALRQLLLSNPAAPDVTTLQGGHGWVLSRAQEKRLLLFLYQQLLKRVLIVRLLCLFLVALGFAL